METCERALSKMTTNIERLFEYYCTLDTSDSYKEELRQDLKEIQAEIEAAYIEAMF